MHTKRKHTYQKCDCNNGSDAFVHILYMFLNYTKYNCCYDKQHRDRSGGCICVACLLRHICNTLTNKGSGYHIRKCCDNKQCEQPAKQHKKLSSCLTDILLDDHTHRFSFVLHRCIQSTEILYGSEEQSTDQQPEQYRHPAEYRCKDWSGYRACTCNG